MYSSNFSSCSCMRYCFDIDGTICDTPLDSKGRPDYLNAMPNINIKNKINELYDRGNYIIFQTARGKSSGKDWTKLTQSQLKNWGFKYHELFKMFCKPTADLFIDDKGINVKEWIKCLPIKKGITAGAFDIIHPGYIRLFKQAKLFCNHLTIALHDDPSKERSFKLAPVQSIEDRKEILEAIKYIDDVIFYKEESTFIKYLDNFDIRFIGTDYIKGNYSAKDHKIEICWINRNHNYSATHLKNEIYKSITSKNKF